MEYCHLKPKKLLDLHFTTEKISGSWMGCDWEILENDVKGDGTSYLRIKVSNEFDWDIATIHRKRQTGTLERVAQLCVASFTLLQIQKRYGIKPI